MSLTCLMFIMCLTFLTYLKFFLKIIFEFSVFSLFVLCCVFLEMFWVIIIATVFCVFRCDSTYPGQ